MPADPTTQATGSPAGWKQTLRLSLGVLVGCGAIWFALSAAGGWRVTANAVVHTDARWLAGAVVAQVLGVVLSAVRLRRLAGSQVDLSLPAAGGLELVMNGLGVLAPAAPAEALAYGVQQLRRRGLDKTRAGLVLGLEQWFSYRVIYLIASLNLLVILARRDFPMPGQWPGVASVVALLVLAVTGVAASRPSSMEHLSGAWARVHFWVPRPSAEQRRLTGMRLHKTAMSIVGRPRDRIRLVGLSVAGHLTGVLTLVLAMRAVGVVIDADVALLASAAAVLASSIPLLPAGLGLVETVVPAVLAWYGAPLDLALAGAVVARVVGTVLPAVAGAVALWALQLTRAPSPVPDLGTTPEDLDVGRVAWTPAEGPRSRI
jgi:uncharacterized protein (TIRG00374 family)